MVLKEKFNKILKNMYLAQLILFLFTIGGSFILVPPNGNGRFYEFILLVVIIIFGVRIPYTREAHRKYSKVRKAFYYLNTFFQSIGQLIVLPVGLASLTVILHVLLKIPYSIISIFAFIYLLVMYLPTTYFVLSRFKTFIGRIILLAFIVFFEIGMGSRLSLEFTTEKNIGEVIQNINISQSIDTLVIILNVSLLMFLWNYVPFPSFSFKNKSSNIIDIALFLFMLWFVIWNGFGDPNKFLFGYDFALKNISYKDLLRPIETISEEWIFRFAILTLSLDYFSKYKDNIRLSIITNGICFGVWHLTNIFSGEPIMFVLQQSIFGIGLGILFSAVYLYTKNLTLTIIIHFLINFIAFVNMGGIISTNSPGLIDWLMTIVWIIMFIFVAYILTSGNRKNVIKQQLPQFIHE